MWRMHLRNQRAMRKQNLCQIYLGRMRKMLRHCLVVKLRSQVSSSVSVSQPQHQDVDDQQQSKSELQRQKNAAAMCKYRSNIKSNSERYRLHRRLECNRLQSFRRSMSPEQKERQRQLSCLRMRRLRERRKASGSAQREVT